jgi:hypothetical protein
MQRALALIAALSLPLPAAAQHAQTPTGPTRAVKPLYDAGFKDCAPQLDATVRIVHEDDAAYAHLGAWSKERPNDEAVNVVTAETLPGATSVTSFTGVKSASGKCGMGFTQVMAVPDSSCERLAKDLFRNWKFYGDLGGSPVFEDPTTPSVSVVLIAMTPTSCVIFKQATLPPG